MHDKFDYMKFFLFQLLLFFTIFTSFANDNNVSDRRSTIMIQKSRYVLIKSRDSIAKQHALETLNQYAEEGNGFALNILGIFHLRGRGGLEKDTVKACELFRKSADAGTVDAMCNAAKLYRLGKGGVAKDYDQAYKYYRMAADNNHKIGIFWVGRCYYKGFGVKKDFKKAYEHFVISDKNNLVIAKYLLGVLTFKGWGIEVNTEEGAKLVKEAYALGYKPAQKFMDRNNIK